MYNYAVWPLPCQGSYPAPAQPSAPSIQLRGGRGRPPYPASHNLRGPTACGCRFIKTSSGGTGFPAGAIAWRARRPAPLNFSCLRGRRRPMRNCFLIPSSYSNATISVDNLMILKILITENRKRKTENGITYRQPRALNPGPRPPGACAAVPPGHWPRARPPQN